MCIFQLHPSVSFPVTIDGFLCLPAHIGTQGVKWTDRGTGSCLSVCPVVWVFGATACVWLSEYIWVCTGVEAEAWHLSGWGAYENIGPNLGQISTSVIIAVVTDSQTLAVLPSLLFLKKWNKKKVKILLICCYIFGRCSWAGLRFARAQIFCGCTLVKRAFRIYVESR